MGEVKIQSSGFQLDYLLVRPAHQEKKIEFARSSHALEKKAKATKIALDG